MPNRQLRPDPNVLRAGGILGDLIGGRVGTPGVYEDTLKQAYDADYALHRARDQRGQAIRSLGSADEYERMRSQREAYAQQLGLNDALYTASLTNPDKVLGGLLQGQEFTNRQGILGAPDWETANRYAMAVDGKPLQLAGVQGDTVLGNRYVEGGDVRGLTPLGEARVDRLGTQMTADRALAGQRSAAANLSNVRAAAGGFAPRAGGGTGAAGNRVFTFFDNGRQITAPSPDGQHYFGPDGNLVQMPPTAVQVPAGQAIPELTRGHIRTEMDRTLGSLESGMPAPGSDPFAQAVDEISGPLASTVGRPATFVTGLGGDSVRRPQRESEAFVDNVNQMVKSTLVNNPRFPQFEQRLVERLLPGPGVSAGQQVARANELRRVLMNQIQQKRSDLAAADPVEARRINQDVRQLSQILGYMNQGPASTRSGRQPARQQVSPGLPDSDQALLDRYAPRNP